MRSSLECLLRLLDELGTDYDGELLRPFLPDPPRALRDVDESVLPVGSTDTTIVFDARATQQLMDGIGAPGDAALSVKRIARRRLDGDKFERALALMEESRYEDIMTELLDRPADHKSRAAALASVMHADPSLRFERLMAQTNESDAHVIATIWAIDAFIDISARQ